VPAQAAPVAAVQGDAPPRDRTRAVIVLLIWSVVGLATATTVYATDASAGVSALLVGLAVVTGAIGWFAAEQARVALEKANERRTRELKNALT